MTTSTILAYRNELLWVPEGGSAWAENAGWNLFVDGKSVAHTPNSLTCQQAHDWANSELGEGMNWLQGHSDPWYWVAGQDRRCTSVDR